jgi:hypothetical protein
MKASVAVRVAALSAAVIGMVSFASAQTGTVAATQAQQDAAAIVATIGKSMQALTTYSYQQRIQVAYDSEVKTTILNEISFTNGAPVITQLSQSSPDNSGRRLGHRVGDKKKEEIEQDVKDLTAAAKGYLAMDKTHMEQLAKTAAVSYQGPNILLTAKNLMMTGDAVTLTALASNMSRVAMQVTTVVDSKPVTINVTYANLAAGLNYASHYTVNDPSDNVELTVDTLNYAPNNQ